MEKANKVSLQTSKKSHRHAFEVFFMYIRHISLQISELLLDGEHQLMRVSSCEVIQTHIIYRKAVLRYSVSRHLKAVQH